MPRFSIVVPAYNAETTLRETLDSVLAQDYGDWECIVVDDGSTDSTAKISEEYCRADDRFRLVRQENKGTSGAYRSGVAAASAELIAICSADDLLLPNYLSTMDACIGRNLGFDIYSCNGEVFYCSSGERQIAYSGPEWSDELSFTFDMLTERCFFGVGAVFRKTLYDLTGGHRMGAYLDDYDLWLRALAKGALHRYTPEVLATYRVWESQKSADPAGMIEARIATFRYLLEHESLQPEQKESLRGAIERNQRSMENYLFGQQAARLHRTAESLFGSRGADRVLRAIHSVSGATRPLRKALMRAGRVWARK